MKLAAYLHSAPPHRIVGGERMTLALLEKAQQAGWEVSVVAESFIEPAEYNGIQIAPARDRVMSRHILNDAKAVVTHPELIHNFNVENVVGIVHNLSPYTLESAHKHSWRALVANSLGTQSNLGKMGIKTDVVIRPPLLEPRFIAKRSYDYVMTTNMSRQKGVAIFLGIARALTDQPFLGVLGGYNEQNLETLPNLITVGHGPLDLAFANAGVFVSASHSETYGMALAEALAAGLPAVVSDIPAHREVAGEAAIFMPLSARVEAWAEAVKDLKTDKELWKTQNKLALQRAEELKQQTQQDFERWLSLLDML